MHRTNTEIKYSIEVSYLVARSITEPVAQYRDFTYLLNKVSSIKLSCYTQVFCSLKNSIYKIAEKNYKHAIQ